MELRRAMPGDIDGVFDIFTRAIAAMRRDGLYMWSDQYPSRATLAEDVGRGEMYLGGLEDRVVSALVINREAPKYEEGRWQYASLPWLALHRVCVDPDFARRGIGRVSLLAAEAVMGDMGAKAARLDTFDKNIPAQRLYEQMGYSGVGQVEYEAGRFFLYEKKL